MAATRLTFPEAEAACLRKAYEAADVILEYGSGGSTVMAADMPGKLIFSVESDRAWAMALQKDLDSVPRRSPAIVWHVDIGPTAEWGRPVDTRHWAKFHHLPMKIWDEPFFRHPDVVLVDGRFRPACFAATCLRIDRPVRLLMDDYVGHPVYHTLERIATPVQIVGRMAIFDLEPGLITQDLMGLALSAFSWATYSSTNHHLKTYGSRSVAASAPPETAPFFQASAPPPENRIGPVAPRDVRGGETPAQDPEPEAPVSKGPKRP